MTGGWQGSGIDSAANIFAKACTIGGLHVYGKREYYSNIIGAHSYFQVRVDEKPVHSHVDTVDLLVTFDEETLFRHTIGVRNGGGVIYDPDVIGTPMNKMPFLEPEVVEKLQGLLKPHGLPETVAGMLELAEKNGVKLFPIPFAEIIDELTGELGEAMATRLKKTVNTMAVAASFGILGFELSMVQKGIESQFKGKVKIVDMNVKVAEKAYNYAAKEYAAQFPLKLKKLEVDEKRIYVQGTQAVALGKIAAGCSFQTYYPITPASDESVYLEAHEVFKLKNGSANDQGSIVVVQTEDEIAAITMAAGAALAGARAATATSGPGFSLMAEGMGWTGMNEVPVVITLYQRGGPATGLPTRHEQGELRFALHAAHGEFPRIVLASGDLEECFYDSALAFNYAEQFQTPVVHIIDKALANSTQTYPVFDTSKIKINRGKIVQEEDLARDGAKPYKRFQFAEDGVSPRTPLGTKGGIFWNTGDEHDELGHISEDPTNRNRMMEKRMSKLATAAEKIPLDEKVNFFGDQNADTTIISWGSTKGAIIDALELLKDDGLNVNFLQVRLINPLPVDYIADVLKRAKVKIGIEMNYSGQFAGIIREQTGIAMDYKVVKYNGRPMSRDEIYESVKTILTTSNSLRKVVLSHGA